MWSREARRASWLQTIAAWTDGVPTRLLVLNVLQVLCHARDMFLTRHQLPCPGRDSWIADDRAVRAGLGRVSIRFVAAQHCAARACPRRCVGFLADCLHGGVSHGARQTRRRTLFLWIWSMSSAARVRGRYYPYPCHMFAFPGSCASPETPLRYSFPIEN